MGTTTTYGFRYSELGDSPNGPAQLKNLADDVEAEFQRRRIVARNARTTIISTTGAIIRVMSTRAAMVNGRTYRVAAMLGIDANTANVHSQTELRYTTDDTEPTVTSTVLQRAVADHRLAATPETVFIEGLYHATSSGWLRVCICIQRVVEAGGSVGTVAAATYPTTLTIQDCGPTIATSGTVY